MKVLFITIAIYFLAGFPGFTQANTDGSMPQFLYPEFIRGEVKLKNGKSQTTMLNYNTVTGKMTYKQNDLVFDIINIETIDTVFIYKSQFVPMGEKFFEVLHNDDIALFVRHAGTVLPPGKPAAYGGTSQLASSTYLSSVELQSGRFNLPLPSDFEVKIEPEFSIRKDGNISVFITERQFYKIFPGKEAELKKYIRQNKLKFDRIPDMMKLAAFCNTLKN